LLPAGSKLASELYLLAPPFVVKSACPRAAPPFSRTRRQSYVAFCSIFCFLNHSHDTYFEHQLQQQIEGYPAKRADKVLQITPKTIYQEDQIKSSKNSGRISVTKNLKRAHS